MSESVIVVPPPAHFCNSSAIDFSCQICPGPSSFSSANTIENGPHDAGEFLTSGRSWRQQLYNLNCWQKTRGKTPRVVGRATLGYRVQPEDHHNFAEYVKSVSIALKTGDSLDWTHQQFEVQRGAMHAVEQRRRRRAEALVRVQAVLVCWEDCGSYRVEPLPLLKNSPGLGQLFDQMKRLWGELGPWWVRHWPFTTFWIKEVEIHAPYLRERRFEATVSQANPIEEDLTAVEKALHDLGPLDSDGDCPRNAAWTLPWNDEPCLCEYCNYARLAYRYEGLLGMSELTQAFERPERFSEKDFRYSRLYKAGAKYDDLVPKTLIHDFEHTASAMKPCRWPKVGYLIHYQMRQPKNPTEWAVAALMVLVASILAFATLWEICTLMPERLQDGGNLAIALVALLASIALPWLTNRHGLQHRKEKSD